MEDAIAMPLSESGVTGVYFLCVVVKMTQMSNNNHMHRRMNYKRLKKILQTLTGGMIIGSLISGNLLH